MRISAPLALGLLGLAGCGKTPPESLLFPSPADAEVSADAPSSIADVGRDGGPLDASGPDFGLPPADGGAPADLGPPDLGAPPDSGVAPDAGPPLCELGSIRIAVSVTPDRDFVQETVRVASTRPLVLQAVRSRERFTVTLSPDTPVPRLEEDERYQLIVQRGSRMADDVFVALSTAGGGGELVYAAWATVELPQGLIPHVRERCGADPLGCGELDRLVMNLDVPGQRVRVRPGERARFMGYELVNGRSRAYAVGPTCPETPATFYEGALSLNP